MGLVRGEFSGDVVVGVEAAIRVLVLVQGDALCADLDVGDAALAVAKHHVARRAEAVLPEDVDAFAHTLFFQQDPLEGVVGQGETERAIAQAVGKVGDAVLVHAHITELAGKGESEGSAGDHRLV